MLFLGGFEVDLLLEHVDAVDGDFDDVPDLIYFFGTSADEAPFGGVVRIEVSLEGGDMDETGEQKFGQLDEESEIARFHDDGAEFLAFFGCDLELEILEFF